MTSLASPRGLSPYRTSILPCTSPGTPRRTISSPITTPHAQIPLAQDELSSSDKENSPANAYISRNSENTSCETSSNTLSFTPRRLKAPPRAWERRPATPYVPRKEGQKIWKRVPLGELRSEQSNTQESRRNREGKEDYIRAVKKLKVEDGVAGVIASGGGSFVAMKWEEENIEKGGSPKKKAQRQGQAERDIKARRDGDIMQGIDHVQDPAAATGSNDGRSLESTSEISASTVFPHNESVTSDVPSENGAEVLDETTENNDIDSIDELRTRDENSYNKNLDKIDDTQDDVPSMSNHDLDDTTIHGEVQSKDINDNAASLQIVDIVNTEEGRANEVSPDEPATHTKRNLQGKHQVSSAVNFVPADLSLEPLVESASSTTIQLQGVTSEETDTLPNSHAPESLPSTKDSACDSSQNSDQVFVEDSQLDTMPVSTRSMRTFIGTDIEETAFLHDFLLRARASKAARAEVSSSDLNLGADRGTCEASNNQIDKKNPWADDATEDLEASPNGNVVQNVTKELTGVEAVPSPIRRSARTATGTNTKLLHPQTLPLVPQFGPVLPSQNLPLPNTIQLKRATGSEFIFNAKIQQTLAMTTRANTKRNQASSVNVMTRLAQIRSDLTSAEEDCQREGDRSPGPVQTLISVDVPSPAKNDASKKRKRVKNDEGPKTKKSVKWNEDLTSYREPAPASPESKPTSRDFAEIEAAAQAEALLSLTSSFTFPKPIPSDPLKESNEIDPTKKPSDPISNPKVNESGQSDSSKLKVRKLRKVNIGSVNGTPAPKTRSQSSRLVPPSSVLPSNIPKSSSKLPAPTSTSISISIPITSLKTPGMSRDNSASTTHPSKEQVKESDRKLPGRRSLRMRS